MEPGTTATQRKHCSPNGFLKPVSLLNKQERASLTDVDVIVFVNNTQLDAVDQLRLLKASRCTQRTKTSTAIHPHHPLPAVSSFSLCAEELRRGCCCHKVTPSIHPRHTHLHPAITDTFPSAGPFRSLPCR